VCTSIIFIQQSHAVPTRHLPLRTIHPLQQHPSRRPLERLRARRPLRYQKVLAFSPRSMIAALPGDRKVFMGEHLELVCLLQAA
jgi:hypothetical protein